ncbi:transmembrane protein, putative (macronuclear) [Tetrahymena thermophila SB210]|uniref:Transmembrane protein, putative n=1 Tax=Tetrahymena thermophila (strain SB210) TaxID=312017 RepID=W7XG50_TETTS|nr:transmembrane protein, putative [Tetrahymena thermophila SB210]EWS71804.1 transmembrane protein, putative [Tetrahymena thermophila SB210]|eukprot:XP_012655691.1 transmembrane protein, putative [Tetrahymena thermophila SB210]
MDSLGHYSESGIIILFRKQLQKKPLNNQIIQCEAISQQIKNIEESKISYLFFYSKRFKLIRECLNPIIGQGSSVIPFYIEQKSKKQQQIQIDLITDITQSKIKQSPYLKQKFNSNTDSIRLEENITEKTQYIDPIFQDNLIRQNNYSKEVRGKTMKYFVQQFLQRDKQGQTKRYVGHFQQSYYKIRLIDLLLDLQKRNLIFVFKNIYIISLVKLAQVYFNRNLYFLQINLILILIRIKFQTKNINFLLNKKLFLFNQSSFRKINKKYLFQLLFIFFIMLISITIIKFILNLLFFLGLTKNNLILISLHQLKQISNKINKINIIFIFIQFLGLYF